MNERIRRYRTRRPPIRVEARVALAAVVAVGIAAASSLSTAIAAIELTDTQISAAVEDELLFDQAVRSTGVDVLTLDGVVTLDGTVSSLIARERAANLAATVRGVRAVVNEIRVAPAPDKTDERLEVDVLGALAQDPATESYEVSAEVEDGVLTLTGTVDSFQERRLAEKVAGSVTGIVEMRSELTVAVPVDRADSEIEKEIEQKLEWDALVDHEMIEVFVEDGDVRLGGVVGSAAEKRVALGDAWVAGVSSVDGAGLEVEYWARDPKLRRSKYVVRADEDVADAVEDALVYDPRVPRASIDIEVDDGVVTLRGEVDHLRATRAAAETARNTVGVFRVVNRIDVDPTEALADAIVEGSLEDALLRDPFVERYELAVEVDGGVATLDGTVDTVYEKARAEEVAATVDGVVAVRNRLEVADAFEPFTYDPYVHDPYVYDLHWYDRLAPAYTFQSDASIRQDIFDQLWWSPFVDAADVEIEVEDGVARLTGTVDSMSEWRAARENAFEGGAVWVDNDLIVKSDPRDDG